MSVTLEFRSGQPYIRFTPDTSVDQILATIQTHGLYGVTPEDVESLLPHSNVWLPLPDTASRDASVEITVSEDRMAATISIQPAIGSGRPISEDDIKRLAHEHGIRAPIDTHTIQRLIKRQHADNEILCAATPPEAGQDGWYEVFALQPVNAPQIREDGTADFRDLGRYTIVQEGDILGRIRPPTPGTAGMNVLGEILPPTAGTPVDPGTFLGDNIGVDDHGGIIARASGNLVHDKDGRYSIQTSILVDGDVDLSTGDIRDFPGDVTVNGSVTEGFCVIATGDIHVKGRIERATVISHQGDILVDQGIIGRQGGSKVSAKGNITARFIESATVGAGGTVTARESIFHSDVTAGHSVVCDAGKGWICGGHITAGSHIQAKTIGSQMSTKTYLRAGYDPALNAQIEEIEQDKAESKATIEQIQTLLQETLLRLGPKHKQYKQLLLTKEHHENNLRALNNLRDEIHRKLLSRQPYVAAITEIFPGSTVEIMGIKHKVKSQRTVVMFTVQDNGIEESVYQPRLGSSKRTQRRP